MRKRIAAWFTKKNIIWLFCMLVFTVICLELLGRFYLTSILHKSTDQKFRFNSYRLYEHVPGFTEGDGERNWIEINHQGFRRSEEVTRFKPEKTFRIFLLGGSAAHGISSAPPYPIIHIYPDETIDHHLEKMLEKKHKGVNFEVINAAVTGYKTYQHTDYILSELLDYHPDMIIFFDGANDHYVNNPAYNLYRDNEYQFWRDRLQNPSMGDNFDFFMLWMSDFSAFSKGYMSWKMNRDALPKEDRITLNFEEDTLMKIEHHKMAAKKTYLRSMETNISILKNNDIYCLITLQPMLVLRKKALLAEAEKSLLRDETLVEILHPYVVEEIIELTKKHQVPFVDINPFFSRKEDDHKQLFIDYCHLSALGGKKAAEGMFAAVDSLYLHSLIK